MAFKKLVMIWAMVASFAAVSHAATIFLQDGSQIKGTVVSATARELQVRTDTGTETVATRQIQRIEYAENESPPAAAAPATTYAPPAPPRSTAGYYREYTESELRQSFSLGVGGAIPLSRVDFGPTGGGTDTNGSGGVDLSARYFYNLLPRLSVGPDVSYLHRGRTQSQSLLPNSNTDVYGNTVLLLVDAKYSLVADGPVRPYLLGGVGGNRTSTIAEATPDLGFAWSNTNTDETRTLVDDAHWGFASQVALGIDFPMQYATAFGLEFGWIYLNNAAYGATPAGQDLGLTALSGNQNFLTITGRLSWRFP